jgi:hypothetical protein
MSSAVVNHLPTELLEQRAAEQRERIHNSVDELKSSLRETVREHLDVRKYAREHIWGLLAVGTLVAMVSGYGLAGMFSCR